MKLKQVESELSALAGFSQPKRALEQYATTPHLAARMIYTAHSDGNIEDVVVVDLGCGAGMLTAASVMLGATLVAAVDADPDALAVAQKNCAHLEIEYASLESCTDDTDVVFVPASLPVPTANPGKAHTPATPPFDKDALLNVVGPVSTVIMNPPFGTWVKGADMAFLTAAASLRPHAIYSLNKTSTRDYISKKALSLGYSGRVVAEMRYNLDQSMAHHKDKSRDIQVDMWFFERVA